MTETTNKYEGFVKDFLEAMVSNDLPKAMELTEALKEEEKLPALDALLESIDGKDEEFKEGNKEIIEALVRARVAVTTAPQESSDEPDTGNSEAPSKEAAPVEEAPADNKE